MKPFIFLLLCLLTILPGCTQQQEEPVTQQMPVKPSANQDLSAHTTPTGTILGEPRELTVVELPTEAIPTWHQHRENKPTLVLLSNNPFLQPIPNELQEEIATVILNADVDTLKTRGKYQTANPLLLPQQTLSAAIQTGLFSELVWVLPIPERGAEPSLEIFRQKLMENGVASEEEAKALVQTETGFAGTVRGTPFQVAFPFSLPTLKGPLLLHLDLSYFTALYQNEVKTPIYPLLHKTLSTLRNTGWSTSEATLSLSTDEGAVSLEMRFLGNALAEVFRDPALMDGSIPEAWSLRGEALYLETFFQPRPVLSMYQAMEKIASNDASVLFDLYRTYRMMKNDDVALGYLQKAVDTDRSYTREYLALGFQRIEKGRTSEGIELFQRARTSLPNNPFISLTLAQGYLDAGHFPEAKKIVDELQKENWSPIYYPEIPDLLQQLAAKSQKDE